MTLFGLRVSCPRGSRNNSRAGHPAWECCVYFSDRTLATLLVLLVVAPLWGCGAKGPPLVPLVVAPVPVTDLAVRRLGGEVYVGFTLPTQNRDGTEPADLIRVDVYGMTTQPRVRPDRRLDLEEFEEAATLIESIEVRSRETPLAADPAGEAPVDPRPEQGFPVAIAERLTAAILVPVDPWEDERDDEEEDDDETPEKSVIVPLTTPLLPGPLQREYVVVGVSSKGNEVEAATRIAVPLVDPPVPPSAFALTYTEEVINITWELPPGVRAMVQAPATSTPPPPILQSRPIIEWPSASRYDLYEIVEVQDGSPAMPSPLNTMPLTTPAYADRRVEFWIERCYAVSTLDVVGGLDVRSRLSAETCVTLVDIFPPAAPEGLRAIGSDGAVGLTWQPNDEEDLAGYLVLRGVPPGETLQPLTPEPVPENIYRDTTAEPGVRYVYAVRAVDMVTPPNVSPLSNREENAAR